MEFFKVVCGATCLFLLGIGGVYLVLTVLLT